MLCWICYVHFFSNQVDQQIDNLDIEMAWCNLILKFWKQEIILIIETLTTLINKLKTLLSRWLGEKEIIFITDILTRLINKLKTLLSRWPCAIEMAWWTLILKFWRGKEIIFIIETPGSTTNWKPWYWDGLVHSHQNIR